MIKHREGEERKHSWKIKQRKWSKKWKDKVREKE